MNVMALPETWQEWVKLIVDGTLATLHTILAAPFGVAIGVTLLVMLAAAWSAPLGGRDDDPILLPGEKAPR